jgi:hypothetical protein
MFEDKISGKPIILGLRQTHIKSLDRCKSKAPGGQEADLCKVD